MDSWTHRCSGPPYASGSFLNITYKGKRVSQQPKHSGGGGLLMRFFRTDSLTIESEESQQKAVKGNTSTDDVCKAWHPSDVARLTRLITNHAPTGEFRARFFPNLPTHCACGRTQTRNHILFECLLYVRPHMWFHSHVAFVSHPSNLPLLLQWLDLNPLAFTFDDVPPDPT